MKEFKINNAKLATMMALQDEINAATHSSWRERKFPWYRSIWIGCAEMMGHLGCESNGDSQKPNMDQVRLEIVEIFHSGLSIMIQNANPSQFLELAMRIGTPLFEPTAGAQTDIRCAVESFAEKTLADKHFHPNQFSRLMALSGMSFDDLYCMYVGKNVLIKFRQDHGYAHGSYVKAWNGLGDHKVLARLIESMNIDADEFPSLLYDGLEREYSLVADKE